MLRLLVSVAILFAIGVSAAPRCVDVAKEELSFCFAVDYRVVLDDSETPYTLDRLAQSLYLGQHDFGIEGGCNTEARDLICANLFRVCNETNPAEPTGLKPCRKLCKDFKSCFKVEGDCDEEIYVDVKETDANGVAQCTFVKSDASSVRLAIFIL